MDGIQDEKGQAKVGKTIKAGNHHFRYYVQHGVICINEDIEYAGNTKRDNDGCT